MLSRCNLGNVGDQVGRALCSGAHVQFKALFTPAAVLIVYILFIDP